MKKISKITLFLLVLSGLFVLTACGKEDKPVEEKEEPTIASVLTEQFEKEIKDNKALDVANKIAENEAIKINVETAELGKKDMVSGFKTEIKGYKKAYVIRPMIGSIPFIAYIFEVESPEDFEKTLKDNADLRWNICTEADEMKTAVVDNYVFFIMSPKNFEE